MLDGKRVGVVVPAFNEERLVGDTIAGIPAFVDTIYVVDDASRDRPADRVKLLDNQRVGLLEHERNMGGGPAILPRSARAPADGRDVPCVRAADNQMAREEREPLARPGADGGVDYAKANRLTSGQAWELIPRTR